MASKTANPIGFLITYSNNLGLLASSGRSRGIMFRDIQDRVWDRVNGWNSKLLSQEGKRVLVKAVLQSLPMYAMSCFLLSDYIVRQFLAEFEGGEANSLDSLPAIVSAFIARGMGFRGLKEFNLSLLAK
ncbi:UNVERIFIED_CONTAM: hypothetical protein Slati_0180500 [Sesamum latifolium]|uniref:Uncharacterized protein n=1 Tax=Sesamum latifolium TaxID=2727402 RepID=A0AAW2YB26_9LAMI